MTRPSDPDLASYILNCYHIHPVYRYFLYMEFCHYRTEMLDKDESADSEIRCYTTSCKACVFVEDLARSPCDSCDADDTECMIAYGQCVKKYMRFITVTVSTSHYCMHII